MKASKWMSTVLLFCTHIKIVGKLYVTDDLSGQKKPLLLKIHLSKTFYDWVVQGDFFQP